jgi:hypothetical protein
VDLLSINLDTTFIGISRPSLDPNGEYFGGADCADGWFIY